MSSEHSDRGLLGLSKKELKWIGGVAGGLIFVWFSIGFLLPLCLTGESWDGPGTLGDSFGMVNSLFSALAFLALVVALWIQSREFGHQLREFEQQTKLQRESIDKQAQAASAQIEAAQEQIALLKDERENRLRERKTQLNQF